MEPPTPPQTIISVPDHTAVCSMRGSSHAASDSADQNGSDAAAASWPASTPSSPSSGPPSALHPWRARSAASPASRTACALRPYPIVTMTASYIRSSHSRSQLMDEKGQGAGARLVTGLDDDEEAS